MSFLKAKMICPHCNRESANNLVCTNLGCSKRIDAPVRLFARNRALPVGRMGAVPRSPDGGRPETVQ
jgi:hypothetical protein